jgi:hypothetical protein
VYFSIFSRADDRSSINCKLRWFSALTKR